MKHIVINFYFICNLQFSSELIVVDLFLGCLILYIVTHLSCYSSSEIYICEMTKVHTCVSFIILQPPKKTCSVRAGCFPGLLHNQHSVILFIIILGIFYGSLQCFYLSSVSCHCTPPSLHPFTPWGFLEKGGQEVYFLRSCMLLSFFF